jgi:hypothetical protein
MNPANPNEQLARPQMTQISANLSRPDFVGSASNGSIRRHGFNGQVHLRKSADQFHPIRPREIELHIEELVLHGFKPGDRWRIGDAVEEELRGLLRANGIPTNWLSNPERIAASFNRPLDLTKPVQAGAKIAGIAYGGGTE